MVINLSHPLEKWSWAALFKDHRHVLFSSVPFVTKVIISY